MQVNISIVSVPSKRQNSNSLSVRKYQVGVYQYIFRLIWMLSVNQHSCIIWGFNVVNALHFQWLAISNLMSFHLLFICFQIVNLPWYFECRRCELCHMDQVYHCLQISFKMGYRLLCFSNLSFHRLSVFSGDISG